MRVAREGDALVVARAWRRRKVGPARTVRDWLPFLEALGTDTKAAVQNRNLVRKLREA